jgi:hypothetical protein
MVQEDLACLRDSHAACVPLEQDDAQFGLQFLQAPIEGRRGDVERLCGFADGAGGLYGFDVGEGSQVFQHGFLLRATLSMVLGIANARFQPTCARALRPGSAAGGGGARQRFRATKRAAGEPSGEFAGAATAVREAGVASHRLVCVLTGSTLGGVIP